MNRKGLLLIGILFLLEICVYSAAIQIPELKKHPELDGKLETDWGNAAKFEFGSTRPDKKLENKTTLYLAYSGENLYLAFKCYEKNMDKLKCIWDNIEAHDNSLWQDDCVEIFLNPLAGGNTYYQIVINSAGRVYDASSQKGASWESEAICAVSKQDKCWIVEAAIPFRVFGFIPKGGEKWLGNFAREEKNENELSSLFPTEVFNNTASFGTLNFSTGTDTPFYLECLKEGGKDVIKMSFTNKFSSSVKYKVDFSCASEQGRVFSASKEISCPASQKCELSIPYQSVKNKQQMLKLLVTETESGKVIYENKFTADAVSSAGKVWEVKNPLYKELFSAEPPGIAKEGAMNWFSAIEFTKMRIFAQQYGVEYIYENMYKLYADNKMFSFTSVISSPVYRQAELCSKYGAKLIVFADERGVAGLPVTKTKDQNRHFLPDPKAAEKFIFKAAQDLKNYGDVIWAVSFGDEKFHQQKRIGVELFSSLKDKYSFIHEADEEVKTKYGHGKFGIPESANDSNPFRWIAYTRWLNEKLCGIQKRLYETVKSIKPSVYVISDDPPAMLNPDDFSSLKDSCDIATVQLYPSSNKHQARFGMQTKIFKDLSGVKEVWPCAHVENYADSYTQEESLELLSQVFRNGGNGLHYYPSDTKGRRAGKNCLHFEYYGAPERWQLEMNVAAEIGKINKLKFPEPDFAILYSADSLAVFPEKSVLAEMENSYLLLGPLTGGWFKYINEYQIERHEIDLNKFKAVYVPYAKYERSDVVRKLSDYVSAGGTLVVADPEAFSFDTNGEPVLEVMKELGIKPENKQAVKKFILWKGVQLPVFSSTFPGKVNDATEVLSAFENKSPAVTMKKVGKGKVIYFAVNPFIGSTSVNADWIKFFAWFQSSYLGCKINHDIWRFKFPSSLIADPVLPKGKCLTENHILWKKFEALDNFNEQTDGSYFYNNPPDKIKDISDTGKILFKDGKLTNRKKVPGAGNAELGKSKLEDWIVRWDKNEQAEIIFDFMKSYEIARVKIFYTGELPEISFSGSDDGKNWICIPIQISAKPFTEDVIACDIEKDFGKYRFLRFELKKRSENKYLSVSEIEVWSKP